MAPPPPSLASSPSKNRQQQHHEDQEMTTPTRLICYLFPPPYYLVLGLMLLILPFSHFTNNNVASSSSSSSNAAVSIKSPSLSTAQKGERTISAAAVVEVDDDGEEFEKDLQFFIQEEEKLKKKQQQHEGNQKKKRLKKHREQTNKKKKKQDERKQDEGRRRLQREQPPPPLPENQPPQQGPPQQPPPPQGPPQNQPPPPPPPPPPSEPSYRQYTYLTPLQIHNKLQSLSTLYPEFLTLHTTQSKYNLPTAGTPNDCPYEQTQTQQSPGCSNFYIIIEDTISNPPPGTSQDITNAAGVTKYEALPHIFLTAALHGNDRIGPVVLLEMMELMVECAYCESLPRYKNGGDALPLTQEEMAKEDLQAKKCRNDLLFLKGVNGRTRQWLARLVTTRRTVVLPVANSLGYYRNVPMEGDDDGHDPNFDFPFVGKEKEEECMSTIAARSINEIFREHMFQLGVSFHSTTQNSDTRVDDYEEGVYYNWASSQEEAPDTFSMKEIATTLTGYGGEFTNTMDIMEEEEETMEGLYSGTVGPISQLSNNNNGGGKGKGGRMEDWAYGGSWAKDKIGTGGGCNPTSHGGYNASKTVYDDATLRSIHTLVETQISSSSLEEDETELGTTQDLFTPYGLGNGHVSRNIRLALSTIDLVEPYVTILGVDGYDIKDDIIPLMPRNEDSCRRTKIMKIPEGGERNDGKVRISWTVGGAFTVDSTAIMYGKWSDLDKGGGYFDCMTQPTKEELDVYFGGLRNNGEMESTVRFTEPQSGITRWHKNVPYPPPESEFLTPAEAVFGVDLDISRFRQGDTIAVYAVARVDQGWKSNQANAAHPQSHIVNVRTNPEWFHRREGKVIQGRIDWFSIPLTIEIGHPLSSTMEKSVRSPNDEWEEEEAMENYANMSTWMMIKIIFYTAFFATMVFVCFFCREESDGTDVCAIWRERRRIEKATTVQIEELYEDDDGESGWFNWFRFRRKRRMEGQGGGRFELPSQTIT